MRIPFHLILALLALLPRDAMAGPWKGDGAAACPGESYRMKHAPGGAAPYIQLTAEGRKGNFLIDFGATQSSLASAAFPGKRGAIRVSRFDLPTFPAGVFQLEDYGAVSGPYGGRLGIVGTDFLSKMSAHLSYGKIIDTLRLGAGPCDGGELRRLGFRAFPQAGAYSHDVARVGGPNVPVLPIAIGGITVNAQIDSGYDDTITPHSIDINEALLARLKVAGVELVPAPDMRVATCSGVEMRQVYTVPEAALRLGVTASAPPIKTVKRYRLLLKPRNGCGGIAEMREPAAQLGASFLKTLSPIVIDGKAETVWLRP
jgi:hypothetical protein